MLEKVLEILRRRKPLQRQTLYCKALLLHPIDSTYSFRQLQRLSSARCFSSGVYESGLRGSSSLALRGLTAGLLIDDDIGPGFHRRDIKSFVPVVLLYQALATTEF